MALNAFTMRELGRWRASNSLVVVCCRSGTARNAE
jgi:hypothetical protein